MTDDIDPGRELVDAFKLVFDRLDAAERISMRQTGILEAHQERVAALENRVDTIAVALNKVMQRVGDPGGSVVADSLDDRIGELMRRVEELGGRVGM
jgi:hypothetical protein